VPMPYQPQIQTALGDKHTITHIPRRLSQATPSARQQVILASSLPVASQGLKPPRTTPDSASPCLASTDANSAITSQLALTQPPITPTTPPQCCCHAPYPLAHCCPQATSLPPSLLPPAPHPPTRHPRPSHCCPPSGWLCRLLITAVLKVFSIASCCAVCLAPEGRPHLPPPGWRCCWCQ
jgi:hypothetical protein